MTNTLLLDRSHCQAEDSSLILAVNDNPDFLNLICAVLQSQNFNVMTAETGDAALDLLRGTRPDLIVSDVVMPGIDGIELCRRLKADPITHDIPILLMTAIRYDESDIVEGLRAGAEDYIPSYAPIELFRTKVEHLIIGRKRQEAARLESERQFQALIENSLDIVTILNRDGTIRYESPSVESILGYIPAELVGESAFTLIHPEDVSRVSKVFEKGVRTDDYTGRLEFRFRHKNGSWRVLEAVGKNLLSEPAVAGVVVNSRDITTHKSLVDQLRHAQKLEAIGRLAGGVSHDFNNLLTLIIGYSQLLMNNFDESDQRWGYLEEIEKAAKRATALTNQLLAFGRKQLLQPKVLDLNEVIENLSRMLSRLIGEDIKLITALDPGIAMVKADSNSLEQVIMNLAVNSRDAMPEGGKLTIETANIEFEGQYAHPHMDVPAGNYVMLAVSDTGCGMKEEIQSRIFEPFFTTKEQGKGTGLGLSTVYGIVKQSGGHIWVYSEPGQGTAFKIYLPQVEGTPEAEVTEVQMLTKVSSDPATILLVEDDDAVRKLACMVLGMNGYTVLEAASAREALQQAQDYSEEISIVVTDVVMPEIGGKALANSICVTRPTIKVLYTSGYADESIVQHGLLERGKGFLQKPFTPETLVRKVREVLSRNDEGL